MVVGEIELPASVEDRLVALILTLRPQHLPHHIADFDHAANAPLSLIGQVFDRRERRARAHNNGALVQGERVLLHIIRREDRLISDGTRRVGLLLISVNAWRQPCDSFAQRRSKFSTIWNQRRLILAIHRSGVRHRLKHHVRVGGQVFVDLESDAIAVGMLREFEPRRANGLFAIGQL
jgi:hypothetical protein